MFFPRDPTLMDKATGDEHLILRFYKSLTRAGLATYIERSLFVLPL